MASRFAPRALRAAALILLLAVLASCSAGNGAYESRKDAESKRNDSGRPDVKTVTLRLIFGGDKKAAADEVWSAIGAYVRRKGLNVSFDVQFIPFVQYRDKMLAMAAAGDRWDMNFDADWLSYKQMAAKGAYMALNDLLPKYAPNLHRKYKELGVLSAATVNGHIVGLPWTMKMNERKFAGWRSDLTDRAGIRIEPGSIRTIEDVDWLLREMKKAYPNKKLSRTSPLSIIFIREEWVDLNFYNLGYYLNDPEVRVQPVEQQPFYLESALLAKSWYDDRLINRDALIDHEDGAALWRQGKTLFTLTSHEWANANPGFADPSFRQSMSLLYPDKKYVNRTPIANVVAINRNSQYPELVLRFLDMLETDRELYDLVHYGIEGKTYVLNGEMAEYPEGMGTATSNYMEWGGQWALWKPEFMRPTVTYGVDFWTKEAEFASQSNNVDSPIDGLFIVENKMKLELARREQAIQQYARPIEFGAVDDVEKAVHDYIELQKNNGLDKIIAETQRQIDAYLASAAQSG